ncbi:hypothetical protein [Embleya sp. NPDC059259]|uniref:hypothetical protein n=1 Tax=unclassified Embleya TaxID=2699296 RepID=UPI0036BBFEAB
MSETTVHRIKVTLREIRVGSALCFTELPYEFAMPVCGLFRLDGVDGRSRHATQALDPRRDAQVLPPGMLPASEAGDFVRARRGHRVSHSHSASTSRRTQ